MVKRSIALLVFEVRNCNPNGDPDFEGRPRTLPDGRGYMTDVCLKRAIRNFMERSDSPSFCALVDVMKIDPEKYRIFESLHRGLETDDHVAAMKEVLDYSPAKLLDCFFDNRIFGGTILEKSDKTKSSKKSKGKKVEEPVDDAEDKGSEEVDEKCRFKRTGPVTITFPTSVAPVDIVETTISKAYPLEEADISREQGTLAPAGKKFVQHGLYVAVLAVNPNAAQKTGTTEQDIEVLKKLLPNIFRFSSAAARQGTAIQFIHIWWADHDNMLGSFNEADFIRRLTPVKKVDPSEPSSSLDDYDIPTPKGAGLTFKVADLLN